MKKVFESKQNVFGEVAEQITIYQFDSREEVRQFDEMQHDELCEFFGVYDDYGAAPDTVYHHYNFAVTTAFLIMTDYVACNV